MIIYKALYKDVAKGYKIICTVNKYLISYNCTQNFKKQLQKNVNINIK